MANGFMIESRISATNDSALNRDAIAQIAVAGGELVALTASTKQGDNVHVAAAPAAATLGKCWMAYNPSLRLTMVGENEFAGLTEDPREYTNEPNIVFSVFKPVLYDEIVVSVDCIDNTAAQIVNGDILESKAGQTQLTRVAAATGATAGSTAFEVEHKYIIPFPAGRGKIGMDSQVGYMIKCIQE